MNSSQIVVNINKLNNDIWDIISDIHDGVIKDSDDIKKRLIEVSGYISTDILIPLEKNNE